MKIVTSFSPTRTDVQKRALETWRKYNTPIVAVQCHGEEYAEQYGTDIYWVKGNRYWSKPTPGITSLLEVSGDLLIVNSDIELKEPTLDRWVPTTNELKIGIRTDYCAEFVQLNKFGIDVFSIHSTAKSYLTNPLWALGIPGWDYWVVIASIINQRNIIVYKDDIWHEAHKEQWNSLDYRRCQLLLEFEFDLGMVDIADKIQEITERKHLRKKVVEESEYRPPRRPIHF